MKTLPLLSLLVAAPCLFAAEDARRVEVHVDAGAAGVAVRPTLHGLFFEDINYAADGGLYAEMVENRSFEHSRNLHAWTTGGRVEIRDEGGIAATNPRYARIHVSPESGYSLENAGYGGMHVAHGAGYRAEVRARSATAVRISVSLVDGEGAEIGRAELGAAPIEWGRLEARLDARAGARDARLRLEVAGEGSVDVDVVSLFPEATFRGRRNGMRADIAQALADLKPGFLRFPGGCIVEGATLDNAYRWKDTVGDIAVRRQNRNLWAGGRTPNYYQTYGLGYFEYFQLAEDLGAEAVPVVNCGMACQARRGAACSPEELGEWVQDALDLIEFATGPADSKWGSVRAAMGRPEPFRLKMLGIGNEQWEQTYFDHYAVFHRAIRERHPDIRIISSSGPFVDDSLWRFAWDKFRSGVPADIVDEHYYVPPAWLLANSNRYASYDRSLPQVFVGEYAAHDSGRRSTVRAALAEASYITGLLRNADIVAMASYAPLLARVDHDQWAPNLVWFDNSRLLRTASYHVQRLYAVNRPDRVLPSSVKGPIRAPEARGRAGVGTWNTAAEFSGIRVTAADGRVLFDGATAGGWDLARGRWTAEGGVLRQSEIEENRAAYFGDDRWTSYTLEVRARKLAGREGFMIHFAGPDGALSHWNLGGWNNTQHGLDVPGLAPSRIAGSIETGRWYAIRISVSGTRIQAFLDGALLQEADLSAVRREPLYVAAGVDEGAREWVIFLSNPADDAVAADIHIGGPDRDVRGAWTRLGGEADAVNSFDAPDRIAPVPGGSTLAVRAGALRRELPPRTFEVLRLPRGQ